MNIPILLLILLPLVTAFLIPLLDLIKIRIRKLLVIISGTAELVIILFIFINNYQLIKENNFFLYYYLGGWKPHFGINLALDSIGLFFLILVTVFFFLVIIYSIGIIGHHEGKYYVLLFLLLAAMQGVILTGDLFNLYVFIELITVSSAPLVAFNRTREGTEAGIKYMVYGIISGVFFFIGVILVYHSLGTLNMAQVANHFYKVPIQMKTTIIIFFLLSLLIKLGIFPFHFWLAKAHSACPSSISALLSGVLLKIYIYIFIRLFWIVFDFSLLESLNLDLFIIYISLISSLLGHIFALQTDDIKRMLAFSSIGHIGMIISVLALNTATGFYGGLIHILSHLLMKSTLFLSIGYLLQFTKTHKIRDLKGMAYVHKYVFASFFISSLGMIGIPPLNGFVSKWYILEAFLEKGLYFGVVLILFGSILALFYYLRVFSYGVKKIEPELNEVDRLEINPLFPGFYKERLVILIIFVFVGLVVLTGVFYKYFDVPILGAINDILHPDKYIFSVLGR